MSKSTLLFRSRGNLANDPRYSSAARVISIDEMLSYRNTFREKPTPEFDFATILYDARHEKPVAPPAPLVTSESGYRVKDAASISEGEKTLRNVQSVLNKLTEKNYEELKQQVLQLHMQDSEVIDGVVKRIYDKALDEPAFSAFYAQLCYDIALYAHNCEKENKSKTIEGEQLRKSILTRAQATFEEISHLCSTDADEVDKIRRKKLANIKFVGELFLRNLLKAKVIINIIAEIFSTTESTPTPPSAIDAEVGLELLNVVGKELDKTANTQRVWDVIHEHMTTDAFGTRLKFLFQNLLDLRAANWVKKEEIPEPTPAPSLTPAPTQTQQVRGAVKRSPTDVPPPPPPPPSAEMSREEKERMKQAALACVPETFTTEHLRKACSIVRDTILDRNWEKTKQEFSSMLPGEPPQAEKNSRMACFFGLMKSACLTSRDVDSKEYVTGLTNSVWDSSEVCRGVAWALTDAITERVSEDCPKFYERFAAITAGSLAASHIPVLTAIKDVFARSANYLDALIPVRDGTVEWELDFVTVWESYLKGCVETKRQLPTIVEVLDALGSVRFTQTLRNILPDFVQALILENLCSKEELEQWCSANEANPKMQELVNELTNMIL
mmetsp:Transcript_43841/g.50716  ORF Transcript_43841/g.50716 Transcript_43841/m.50716 type:complete len:612 (+) Transcript_43841:51-1886(+)|eukprot:CAMPEP_0176440246 /NCGR_PEP_ID=MMETSP0127-20121128/20449_1 /TAXON_ID=938130 /ORGANISM="Platyophrya macrostoma, Strain WH" /LENGTH=611 /DNA_ID=CAMNT_0017824719 /DNA_START=50 /DNA_END=1885 /DNA_ORIENTATION=-